MNFLSILEKQSKPSFVLIIVGFVLTGLIGIVDFLMGYEMSFSVFYVLPVAIVTWLMNRRLGLVTSFVGAFVWLGADLTSGHTYSYPLIPIWNTLIRLAFFVIITLLLSALKKATEREREFARIDNLTGAANPRCFYDLAVMNLHCCCLKPAKNLPALPSPKFNPNF